MENRIEKTLPQTGLYMSAAVFAIAESLPASGMAAGKQLLLERGKGDNEQVSQPADGNAFA